MRWPNQVRSGKRSGRVLSGRALQEAIQYKQSVALDPDFKEAWYNLGVSYGRKKKFKEEVSAYEKALALDPKYSRAVFNLAIALEDSGDLPGAVKTYEAFLSNASSERDMADAFVNVGILYTRSGRYEDAIRSYEEAIKRDPDLADASYNLGLTHAKLATSTTDETQRKEHIKQQIEAYQTAIKQRPGLQGLVQSCGCLSGETDLEIDAYQQAIRIRANYLRRCTTWLMLSMKKETKSRLWKPGRRM